MLRYEKKIALGQHQFDAMNLPARLWEFGYQEQFRSRWINSIYFDRQSLEFYQDHVRGNFARHKVRYRWYGRFWGPSFGQIEIKGKTGDLGWKQVESLDKTINIASRSVNFDDLCKNITSKLPRSMTADKFEPLRPAVATRYHRVYFIKPGGASRITIDQEISYTSCYDRISRNFLRAPECDVVVEIKVSPRDEAEIYHLFDGTGIHVNKNSKYINAVALFY